MYDFSTLNSFEFEKLVCDLLNSKLEPFQPKFQFFKEGKDKGVDFYLSKSDDKKIIVQVKHYIKTSLSTLKSNLKNLELPKVKLINPESYFVATSLELSLQDKLKIKEIFNPYIKSTNNIYGREDLNALLTENKHIEDTHYKLWFSSTAALRNIQKYKFEGRRKQFTINVLKKKLRLFVPTFSYFHSLDKLKENKYVIITGEPGVGKTTISDMVIYDFIRRDYEVNIIYDSISEIEESINFDKSKQVFYFDDFLGHTQAEISKSKAAENYLLRIINLIEGNDNKYLILNTRKFILSSFLEESERLNKSDILGKESKVEVKEYRYGVKRRILDLHISESNLDNTILQVLNELAPFICNHKNFSPRIIEFFTSDLNKDFSVRKFRDFIYENLSNPKEIWKHAYLNQISDYDRFVLNTLYSLNGISKKEILEDNYNSRLSYEVENNNYRKPIDSFNKSLRVLNEGFLSINNFYDYVEISFINPSLQDYIRFFIKENKSEKERIIKSTNNIEQWFWLFFNLKSFKNINQNYSIFFLEKNSKYHKNEESIFLCALFIYCYIDTNNPLTLKLIHSVKNWDFIYEKNNYTFYHLNYFLKNSTNNKKLNDSISKLDGSFFFFFIDSYNDINDVIERINFLYKHYNFSIKKFISIISSNSYLKKHIDYFLKNIDFLFKDFFKENLDILLESNEFSLYDDTVYELEKAYNFIRKNIKDSFYFDFSPITERDWEEIIKINLIENENKYKRRFNEDDYDEFEEMIEIDYHRNNFEYDLDKYYSEKEKKFKPNTSDNSFTIYPDDLPF